MTPRRRFVYQQRTAEDVEAHLRRQQRRQQKRQAVYAAYRGNCDRLCEMLREDDWDQLAAFFEVYKPRPRGKPPVDPLIEDMRFEASGRERVVRADNGGKLHWRERRLIADDVVDDHLRGEPAERQAERKRIFDDLVAYLERGRRRVRRRHLARRGRGLEQPRRP
jgi:hypothetical protein